MPLITRTGLLSRTVLSTLLLSFVGAKGCLGGDVTLGYNGAPNAAGIAGNDRQSAGAADQPAGAGSGGGQPSAVDPSGGSVNDVSGAPGSGNSAGAPSAGAAGTNTAPLTVQSDGRISSSSALAVSGVLYSASDGAGPEGSLASGDCESAGHPSSDCSKVVSPRYGAQGVLDWSGAGLLCTAGTVARVLNTVGMAGSPDYAAMWGSALGFDFVNGAMEQPYDASAHGVVGIAFDIDVVPTPGLRVELRTVATPDEPAAWLAALGGSPGGYLSPVRPGHNVVLFQDVKPLPFYTNQAAFDPTQLLSVQFHVPTTAQAPAQYSYCLNNLSLVLGTPATPPEAGNGVCAAPLQASSGFEYDAASACVSPSASFLACVAADDPALLIPATPAVSKLPCVRRLSDNALFVALNASAQPQNWQSLATSAWSHLSSDDFADCTADEAALVAAAPVCPVTLPI